MSWTKERTSLLEKLWTEGKSAAEIAKELGGVTRNAVIGKAHRMGLSGRPSPIKKQTKAKTAAPKKKKAAPKAAAAPAIKPKTKKAAPKKRDEGTELPKSIKPIPAGPKKVKKEIPSGKGLGILDLTDRICKWPIGDPQEADFHFCGEPIHPGRTYCMPHCTEAYQVLQKKAAAAKKAALKAEEKAKAKKAAAMAEDDEDEEDLDDLDDIDVDNIDVRDDDDDDDMVGVGD